MSDKAREIAKRIFQKFMNDISMIELPLKENTLEDFLTGCIAHELESQSTRIAELEAAQKGKVMVDAEVYDRFSCMVAFAIQQADSDAVFEYGEDECIYLDDCNKFLAAKEAGK